MNLKHVVLTSVTRDDLPDGGASYLASCIRLIRKNIKKVSIEILTPDFNGKFAQVETVLDSNPEIFNHNIETIARLTRKIRAKATYQRSLDVLKHAKTYAPDIKSKSSIMLGLGESIEEVKISLTDLRNHGVDIATLGQYLRPSPQHIAVAKYINPKEFWALKEFGYSLGFSHVESGPFVRSSYLAHKSLYSA